MVVEWGRCTVLDCSLVEFVEEPFGVVDYFVGAEDEEVTFGQEPHCIEELARQTVEVRMLWAFFISGNISQEIRVDGIHALDCSNQGVSDYAAHAGMGLANGWLFGDYGN